MIEKFQSQFHRVFSKRFTDLYITCECTLEEFFYGCRKEVYFERIILQGDERSEKFVVVSKEIEVKPGMGPWTVLQFPDEGHERFGHEKSELVVKFAELPHPKFKRQLNDLVYKHKISLLDSFNATPIYFTNLDGEQLEISVDEVISP